MKTMIVSFIYLLGMNCYLTAQNYPTDAGSMMFGGDVSWTSAKGDLYENSTGEKMVTFEMDPSFSYFFIPGLAAGVNVLVEKVSQGDVSNTTLGIGPRLTWFPIRPDKRAMIEGATMPYVGAAYILLKNVKDAGSNEVEATGSMIKLGAGVLYLMANNFGFYGELSYSMDELKRENLDAQSGNQFRFAIGLKVFYL
ncbi:hypothetical protein JW935_10950 [candidate division KSB1 bacterium]|nr:hypothetical protein [candidate division KSB1 bacterium]